MLRSTSHLPDPSTVSDPAVRKVIESVSRADAILHEEGDRLKGHTLTAEWSSSPGIPLTEAVQLRLSLGMIDLTQSVGTRELEDDGRTRRRIRDELWYVVTAYAMNNQKEILRLVDELQRDQPAPTGVGA